MAYKLIDCCPVDARLYDELVELKRISGVTYTSIYRGTDAEHLLHKCGKKSQAELYNGWIRRLPGFNPANPPGQSTHECRSDGVAYRGPRGRRLPYWAVGIDNTNSPALCAAARKRGWVATLTYPGSVRERQHVNFRKEPRFITFRPFKKGANGPRVAVVTARLAYLGFLDGVSPKTGTRGFGEKVNLAVREFQHDYHHKVDGVVGIHTWKQIEVAVRGRKTERKAVMKKYKGSRWLDEKLEAVNAKYGPQRRKGTGS